MTDAGCPKLDTMAQIVDVGLEGKLGKIGPSTGKSCFSTITHKMITELNFIIFELFSVFFLFCDYRTELFLELVSLGNYCELWISESLCPPYRNVLGILFGNFGGGIAEPNLFWN